jgi:hypothetical protein
MELKARSMRDMVGALCSFDQVNHLPLRWISLTSK